jgi:ABC-type uncharacterized transport system permease subunit
MKEVIDASDRLLSVAPSPAFWAAVALYAAAAIALLVVLGGRRELRRLAIGLVIAAWVAHGVDIGWRGTLHVHPAQSVRESIGLLAFIVTGGYLLACLRYRLTLGGVVVMPLALVLLLLARLSPEGEASQYTALGRIHISLATIGVAIFGLASALAAIYLFEDRALRRKKFDALTFKDKGAPLEPIDRLINRLVWAGFPIFTAAVVLGAVWTAQQDRGFDHPEVPLSLVTWGAFASLLVARQIYGWRGRRAAKLTLLGFGAALLLLLLYLARRILG